MSPDKEDADADVQADVGATKRILPISGTGPCYEILCHAALGIG